MRVREIPRGEWRAFLDQFSRDHRAWLASVDRFGHDTARRVAVIERPLGAVTASQTGRGVNIEIAFQQDSHAGDTVRIEDPAALRVDETEQGTARSLEIEDEHGERTRIVLRVAAPPGLLDGVAPGEL
jgi:hypothetical protein